ncbi:MAG: rnhA operon protein [Haloquadratum sp.]
MGEDTQRTAERPAEADIDADADTDTEPDVPERVVDEAERLTRLAERAGTEAEAAAYRDRREDLVDEHGFTSRVREDDDTLVLYPDEWVEDGVVQIERIEDTDRAVEVSLSGPDHGAAWENVEAANREIIAAVEEEHGPAHAANVRAFADFMSNHYLKCVEDATREECEEFLTEYYPRNVWPSDEQESIVADSVGLVADVGDDVPGT